jgi:hypothetical protein
MSRIVLVEVITPIVVAIALAAWIIAIYRANRHPAHAHGAEDAQGVVDARSPRPCLRRRRNRSVIPASPVVRPYARLPVGVGGSFSPCASREPCGA